MSKEDIKIEIDFNQLFSCIVSVSSSKHLIVQEKENTEIHIRKTLNDKAKMIHQTLFILNLNNIACMKGIHSKHQIAIQTFGIKVSNYPKQ